MEYLDLKQSQLTDVPQDLEKLTQLTELGLDDSQLTEVVVYGATADFGWKATQDVATILHLLGLDHERLSYYHNGINRRLTDVHGYVIKEVIA